MMLLVRLIDWLVIFVKVLGGKGYGTPFTRAAAWIAVLSIAAFGVAAVVYGVAHIPDLIRTLNDQPTS